MKKDTIKEIPGHALERLRAADEQTKWRIIIVATIICMIVIVYVWLGYFNPFVAFSAPKEASPAVQSSGQ